MPKTAMNYENCCIYKIEHIDDESLVYVGHTTNFIKRKTAHKYSCHHENDRKYNLKVYQMIRENGGWEMFKMIEIEKYRCLDKREAERRESEVMKELKANMNMRPSYLTEQDKKEYRELNKEKIKEQTKKYREENKEIILQQRKEYREVNKEKINEKQKEYCESNKEKLKKYKKEYYEKNKEKIKCECGCEINKDFLKKHQTSLKHIQLVNKD